MAIDTGLAEIIAENADTAATDADEDTTDDVVPAEPEPKPTKKAFENIVLDSQEAADNFVKDRIARATRSTEKKFADQVKELSEKLKSYETEKLTADEQKELRLSEAEKLAEERGNQITQMLRERTITDLAVEAGLPKNLWDRVRGENDEEIAADINALVALLPKETVKETAGPPSQAPTVKLSPTGDEPNSEPDAKSIVDSLPGFLSL